MIETLRNMIKERNSIVFFGGAGVSTESGIPDFRSETGLYHAKEEYGRSSEEMISHSFFIENTKTFFDYYKKNMLYPDAQPGPAHRALAGLEKMGKLKAVITQNIDGLHQKTGNTRVYELHDSVLRNYYMDCGASYSLDYILDNENCRKRVPCCSKCGGIVKPDVVLYEEPLDDEVMAAAVKAISEADMMIVGGTSLVVYPAAGLIRYFGGKHLVLINKGATSYDKQADLVINKSLGAVLGEACKDL